MNLEDAFPNLRGENYKISSPQSTDYNCIAWAARDTDTWWWPDSNNIYYWPHNAPRQVSLEAFIKAFEFLSYEVCETGKYEDGFEKIAIYTKDGKPSHAAKQINSFYWTSKLGKDVDIQHEIDGVSDSQYGSIAIFMKRPIS